MRFTKIVCFFLAIFSLCHFTSPSVSFSKEPSKKVTLQLWEFSVYEELLRNLLKQFEAENPDIEVKVQQLSWEHGLDKIIISIAAGNAPDLVELGTDWMPKFVESGVLKDITEEAAPLKDHYFLWETVTVGERVYGLPWLAGTRVLFYNRGLFRRAGLDPDRPPETWEELAEAARRIRALDENTYGFAIFVGEPYSPWQEFLPFAWGNGGEVLNADHSGCLLDGTETVEALRYYQGLKPYSLLDRQSQVNNLFADNKVGMQISGSWNFRLIPRLNPRLDFGVALLPKKSKAKGTAASFAGGEVLAILKNSAHPEEAMRLVRFLIEERTTVEIVKVQQNVIPAFKGSIRHPYFQGHPKQRVFLSQLATAVAPPAHARWVDIQESITRAIEEAMIQDRDPLKALQEAKGKIEAMLIERKKGGLLRETAIPIGFIVAALLIVLALFCRRALRPHAPGRSAWQRQTTSFLFLSPWILTFGLFWIYPLLYSIFISFTRYDLLSGSFSVTGLRNYGDALRDPQFRQALGHTLFFAAGTIPFTVVLALGAAVLVNQRIPWKALYQAGLFLPVATSVIVIATIFTYLYSPEGLFNALLEKLTLPKPDPSWLVNTRLALPSIMFMNVWASFGYYMVFFLAGLQAIPASLYDAADIDGANGWQRLFYVTLPHLRPVILLVCVINTIYSLQVFPEVFTMTQGGPLGATTTVVYHLYETGFHKFEMGLASAIAYLLFAIIMVFSVVQMRLLRFGEQIEE